MQTKELVAIKYMRREHVRAFRVLSQPTVHAVRKRQSLRMSRLHAQVTREIRREIINHRRLQHPHIIAFKKVRSVSWV